MMVKFQGATKDGDEFNVRGPVWVNIERICAVYDHTILVDGYKIRVMETADEAVNIIDESVQYFQMR